MFTDAARSRGQTDDISRTCRLNVFKFTQHGQVASVLKLHRPVGAVATMSGTAQSALQMGYCLLNMHTGIGIAADKKMGSF